MIYSLDGYQLEVFMYYIQKRYFVGSKVLYICCVLIGNSRIPDIDTMIGTFKYIHNMMVF